MMQFLRPKRFAKVYADVNEQLKKDDWEHISAANVVYIQGGLKPARRTKKASVKLLHVLEDIYDYYGLTEAGWLFVQFVLATLILQFHWSSRNPSFKSSLIQSMQSYGDVDYQQTVVSEVGSMKEAADYLMGYLENQVQLADDRLLPHESIFVGEYANITTARIVVNIDRTCTYSGLQCYHNTAGAKLNSSRWHHVKAKRFDDTWCDKQCIFYMATVWAPGDQSRAKALERIMALEEDASFLGNFASYISLEIIAENMLDRTGYQFVSLTAMRTNGVDSSHVASKFKVLADTVFMRTTFYSSIQDWGRLALEVAFMLLVASSMRDEYVQWWLCVLHVHFHEIDHENMWWHGTIKYVKSLWNIVDVLSHLSTMGLAISYGIFIAELDWRLHGLDWGDDRLVDLASRFKIWLYCMLGHNIVIGLRMFQFLMTHGGLRIYYNMFIFGSQLIQDFLIFFAYVFFVLGMAIAAFFQISGGNPLFTASEQAIQSMALMTFGFLDYNTFYNKGWGATPDQQKLIQLLFWLTVVLWLVVCQNLIIAIVLEAWQRAMDFQEKSLPNTSSFFKVIILRFVFLMRWYLTVFFSFKPFRQQQILQFLYEVGIEVKDDPEWKAAEEVNKVFNRGAGFFSRWAISCMAEAETLLELFSDPSMRRIYVHVVWLEENFQEKIDRMYNDNNPNAVRTTMSVDIDINKELTREELHEFLQIVCETTLLKSRGMIFKQELFVWKDLEHLEDYIWKVYARDYDDGEEVEEDDEEEEDEGEEEHELDPEGQNDWEPFQQEDEVNHKDVTLEHKSRHKKGGPMAEGLERPGSAQEAAREPRRACRKLPAPVAEGVEGPDTEPEAIREVRKVYKKGPGPVAEGIESESDIELEPESPELPQAFHTGPLGYHGDGPDEQSEVITAGRRDVDLMTGRTNRRRISGQPVGEGQESELNHAMMESIYSEVRAMHASGRLPPTSGSRPDSVAAQALATLEAMHESGLSVAISHNILVLPDAPASRVHSVVIEERDLEGAMTDWKAELGITNPRRSSSATSPSGPSVLILQPSPGSRLMTPLLNPTRTPSNPATRTPSNAAMRTPSNAAMRTQSIIALNMSASPMNMSPSPLMSPSEGMSHSAMMLPTTLLDPAPLIPGGLGELQRLNMDSMATATTSDEPYKRRRKGNFDLEDIDLVEDGPTSPPEPPPPPTAPPPPPTPPPQRKAMPPQAALLATANEANAAAMKKPLNRTQAHKDKNHEKRKDDKGDKLKSSNEGKNIKKELDKEAKTGTKAGDGKTGAGVKAGTKTGTKTAAKGKAGAGAGAGAGAAGDKLQRRPSLKNSAAVTTVVETYGRTQLKGSQALGAVRTRGAAATGFSTPNAERNEHPMYDVLKKVVDLSSARDAPFSVKNARRMRDNDAMSVVSDMTLHKQPSNSRAEELLAALVKEQHDTRLQMRKFETKMTTLLHMHQAMLQQQRQMRGSVEGMLNIEPGSHSGGSDRQYNAMMAVSFTSKAG